MNVLTLDPGALTGYAVGLIGATPRWGVLDLRRRGSTGATLSGFAEELRTLIAAERADIVAFESPYVPHRGAEIPRNAATVRRLHCYAGFIEAVCFRMAVRVYEARPSEICRHFTGQGSWGGRAKKKAATVRVCLAMGWDVEGQVDAADGLALWCFAEAVLDPVAASRRRADAGIEIDLHPRKGNAPRRQPPGVSTQPSVKGNQTDDHQVASQGIAGPGQLQLGLG